MKKEKLSLREKSVSMVVVKLLLLFVFLFLFSTLSGCGSQDTNSSFEEDTDDSETSEDRIILIDRSNVSGTWFCIYVDTETNIQYVSVFNGSAESGLTMLCDTNGLPLIHEGEVIPYE